MRDMAEQQKIFYKVPKMVWQGIKKTLPCRWVNLRDIADGFLHPNPVYSRAYETGYDSQVLGIYMTDRQIEKCLLMLSVIGLLNGITKTTNRKLFDIADFAESLIID